MKRGFKIISHAEKFLFSISALFKRLRCRVETSRHDGIIYAGFTLIELLVVVLIIGILAAVALPQYRVAVAKARFTQLQVWGDSIWKAEQLYYLENGEWTGNFSDLVLGPEGKINKTGTSISSNGKSCALRFGEGTSLKEFGCSILDNVTVPIYIRDFYSPAIYCRGHDGDENSIANKVCKSLGGVLSGSCGSYCQYLLP